MNHLMQLMFGGFAGLALGVAGNWIFALVQPKKLGRRPQVAIIAALAVTGIIAGTLTSAIERDVPNRGAMSTDAKGRSLLLERPRGDFVCNEERRELFTLHGAAPGDRVTFDQGFSPSIEPMTADSDGTLVVNYACKPRLADRAWTIRIRTESGLSLNADITTTLLAISSAAPSAEPGLRIVLTESPFVCDGTRHALGFLSGATPGEKVSFSSPGLSGLSPGQADSYGSLHLIWQCEKAKAGVSWQVAAFAEASKRIGTFLVTSRATTFSPAITRDGTVGGTANTWSNYKSAGGQHGPSIESFETVSIACRTEGFQVADGNQWWYQIASDPWLGKYFVSADAFYNNGQKSGPLLGTPLVDLAVPLC